MQGISWSKVNNWWKRSAALRQFGRRQCLTTVARVGVRLWHEVSSPAFSSLVFRWVWLLLVCCLVKRGLARFKHQMLHPWSDRRLSKKKKTDRDSERGRASAPFLCRQPNLHDIRLDGFFILSHVGSERSSSCYSLPISTQPIISSCTLGLSVI